MKPTMMIVFETVAGDFVKAVTWTKTKDNAIMYARSVVESLGGGVVFDIKKI